MAKRSKKKRTDHIKAVAKVDGQSAVIPANPAWFSRDGILGLILFAAVLLAYTPIWYAGFIWDDLAFVTGNPVIVGPLGLKEIWTTSHADICPLTLTTFWAEYKLWGLMPLPYHLVNVLLHGACAVLLWRVFRSLMVPGAWLGAALWALHPVQVESVAWITEMKNTQSCLFYLLSIFFFLKWLQTKQSDDIVRGRVAFALTFIFAALAVTSKSSTVILPVVLGMCAWWVERRWQWRNMTALLPFFLMSIAAGATSLWTQQITGAEDIHWIRSWPERLASAGDAVWFYLGKLLWPSPLIIIYPRWHIDSSQAYSYLPLLAVVIGAILLLLIRRPWSRPCLFVLIYFLVALAPALGLINNTFSRYSFVADHFQYLASMGPLALAGAVLFRLTEFIHPGKFWLRAALGAGTLLVLGLASADRARVFENENAIWTDTLAKNPNSWSGHNNFANALFRGGQIDAAISHYRKALEIYPDNGEALYNLATALSQKGQLDEAILDYRRASELNPGDVNPLKSLGLALLQEGRTNEALSPFQKALKIDPASAEINNYLGLIFAQTGQTDQALSSFQTATEIAPNFAEAHNNLGIIFIRKGDTQKALGQFHQALLLKPDYADAQKNLAVAQSAPAQKVPAKSARSLSK